MAETEYLKLDEVDPELFLPILNSQKIREHLIEHELFDAESVRSWIDKKITLDSVKGCRVRAIVCKGLLAGWCGIQPEGERYEIAIVIDNKFWGLGREVFSDIMRWAKEMGHKEIFIHFLHTRPEYKFLRRIAKAVYESELLGDRFTTYQLAVK